MSVSTSRAEELASVLDGRYTISGGEADTFAAALRSLARERDELLDHKAMLLTTVNGLQQRAETAERERDEYQLRLAAAGVYAQGGKQSLSDAAPSIRDCPTINKVREIRERMEVAEAALAAERQRAERLADALTALLEVPEVRGEIYWPSDRAVRDAARAALADEREEGK